MSDARGRTPPPSSRPPSSQPERRVERPGTERVSHERVSHERGSHERAPADHRMSPEHIAAERARLERERLEWLASERAAGRSMASRSLEPSRFPASREPADRGTPTPERPSHGEHSHLAPSQAPEAAQLSQTSQLSHADVDSREDQEADAAPSSRRRPRALSPIVPGSTVTGHALVAVIAIMTFLAGLTIGGVAAVRGIASEWTSEIARETTIQLKPADGLDIEAALAKAVEVARQTSGVSAARVLGKAETAALLEPWLGAGLDIGNLPVPRLVVVSLAPNATAATISTLRASLSAQVPSASLDDHRQWSARLTSTARVVVGAGLAILALVSAATVLSVVFATRAAVAAGRSIVEVLHFVGARDNFIAAEFQHHFLTVGLKGGAIGGGAAMLVFFLFSTLPSWLNMRGGDPQIDTLIGGMTLDLRGYGGIFGVIVLVALVTSATSRITVYRTLRSIS